MNRPPIVTILGHVDHGKTTLLDTIRKSRIAAKEHGGITQRIGAYEIDTKIKGYQTSKITFIDTPGHEAFSKLRARGATVADIAILIIDAKDSVMPQTKESIAHIKTSSIPFIVALNKVDLPEANPKKVKRDLLQYEVITEDQGGNVITVEISAKTGHNVNELLESILLLASEQNLSYETTNAVQAYIIETKKDARGIVASVIIKDGVMKTGDQLFTENEELKVRSMINDQGEHIKEVHPSMAFELLGFSEMPTVGTFITSDKEKLSQAKEEIKDSTRQQADIHAMLNAEEEGKKLSLVIKADSHGSLEAIIQALEKNENVEIVLSGVGNINRSDIFLAKTTKSIVIGFSVPVSKEVTTLAKQEKVIIKTYNIIYELLEELQEVSDLLREKEEQEKNLKGQAKVLASFIIEGETVYGGLITKGKVNIGDNAEIYRDGEKIGETKLVSLRIRAKTVQEVKKDQECGMMFAPELDIKVGDMIKYIL